MQKTRAKFETRGDALGVPNAMANFLQHALVSIVHLDVGQKRKIVSSVEPVEMSPQISRQRRFAGKSFCQGGRIDIVREQLDALTSKNGDS